MPNHENLTSPPPINVERLTEAMKSFRESEINQAKHIMAKIVIGEIPINFRFANDFMFLWFNSDREEE